MFVGMWSIYLTVKDNIKTEKQQKIISNRSTSSGLLLFNKVTLSGPMENKFWSGLYSWNNHSLVTSCSS